MVSDNIEYNIENVNKVAEIWAGWNDSLKNNI